MKKIIVKIYDLMCKIFPPIIFALILLLEIYIGILFFILPFTEGEHWWELFIMWPAGIVHLFGAIGLPIVLVFGDFRDTIEKNTLVP